METKNKPEDLIRLYKKSTSLVIDKSNVTNKRKGKEGEERLSKTNAMSSDSDNHSH